MYVKEGGAKDTTVKDATKEQKMLFIYIDLQQMNTLWLLNSSVPCPYHPINMVVRYQNINN